MRQTAVTFLLAFTACAAFTAQAQTTATEPWVRGTVSQQKATAMFVQLTSAQGGRVVAASSPVAGVVEIHEMAMEGNVMRMRAVPALELPAGKVVVLQPQGLHVMLMGLKQPLKVGETVAVTLEIESKEGKRESLKITAPVRALGGAGPNASKH
jgi:periplasmic copper chaperone A